MQKLRHAVFVSALNEMPMHRPGLRAVLHSSSWHGISPWRLSSALEKPDHPTLPINAYVMTTRLTMRPEFNNRYGRIISFDEKSKRYGVLVTEAMTKYHGSSYEERPGTKLSLKPECLVGLTLLSWNLSVSLPSILIEWSFRFTCCMLWIHAGFAGMHTWQIWCLHWSSV